MIQKLIFSIFFLFAISACAAQTGAPKSTWLEKHSDEPYVILLYNYAVRLNHDGSYLERIHRVTMIQNELGMSKGEISFMYNKKHQVIRRLIVSITTQDGKKYSPSMVQDSDALEEGAYSDFRKKIITMPNAVPGSVIDFQLEIFNKETAIRGEFFSFIELFSLRPVKEESYSLTLPIDKPIYFRYLNCEKRPQIQKNKKNITYTFIQKDDEGYEKELSNEVSTPPLIEYMPHVSISTIKDWPEFARWYWQEFSPNVIVTPEIKSAAEALVKDKVAHLDKIAAIAKYLKDNFRYVAMSFDEHNYKPHKSVEVFANKFGDCKDQSLLLVSMLKAIGIEAFPVLVRELSRGDFAGLLPDPSCFSHVIVMIPDGGNTYFVDPLEEGYRVNELPESLEGDYILAVDGRDGKVMRLPFLDLKDKTTLRSIRVVLREDGSALAEYEDILDRQDSIERRKSYKLATDQTKKELLMYMESLTQGGKILDFQLLGLDDEYGLVTIKIKSENPQYIKPRGPLMIFGFLDFSMSPDFPNKERKFPIEFAYESQFIQKNEYVIPDGFTFEYIPDNLELRSTWMDFSVTYAKKDKVITQEMHKHYKRAKIPVLQYKEFRDFLLQAEKKMSQCIIIKKDNINNGE